MIASWPRESGKSAAEGKASMGEAFWGGAEIGKVDWESKLPTGDGGRERSNGPGSRHEAGENNKLDAVICNRT